MIVRKITIVVRGETEADVEDAFNEAVDRLNNGCINGKDSNESSGFYFDNSDNVLPGEIPLTENNVKSDSIAEPKTSMTGLLVSLNDGESWGPTNGVRVMFHDANEADDEMNDLLVNITTEGIILDLTGQESGEVSATSALMIEDLIGLALAQESIKPISFSCGVKSISDDDLCAKCKNCDYQPGKMSGCSQGWPSLEDVNGYVQECSTFMPSEES